MKARYKNNQKVLNVKLLVILLGILSLVIFIFFGRQLRFTSSSLRTFLLGTTTNEIPSNILFANKVSMTKTKNPNIWQIPPKKNPATVQGPTFTLDYAKAYIISHPFQNGKTTTGQTSSIESIYFATNQQLKILTHGIWPYQSPNDLSLVVIENGPFLLDNTSWPDGQSIPIAKAVIRVFDAHTGFRLMWGDWEK